MGIDDLAGQQCGKSFPRSSPTEIPDPAPVTEPNGNESLHQIWWLGLTVDREVVVVWKRQGCGQVVFFQELFFDACRIARRWGVF